MDFSELMKKAGYVTAEELDQQSTETVAETQEVIETPNEVTETTETQQPQFDFFSELNKKTGKEFKTEEELKTFFEQYDNINNTLKTKEEQEAYYLELEKNLQDIADKFDPVKQYGSKEEWEKSEMVKQIGKGKNPVVVNDIVYKDLDKMDKVKLAAYNFMLNSPDITEEDAIRFVLRKVGVNIKEYDETNEKQFDIHNPVLTSEQKVEISLLASEAKNKFANLKESVKLPDTTNVFDTIKQKVKESQDKEAVSKVDFDNLKTQWGKEIQNISSNPPVLKIPKLNSKGEKEGDFEYALNRESLKEALDVVGSDAISRKVAYSEENKKAQGELLKMYYVYKNLDHIANAYAQEKITEMQKTLDDKIHNSQPINTATAPPSGEKTKEDIINEQARDLAKSQGLL